MGLIKKFSALVRSNLNAWLNHAEDPQKLAELALLESEQTRTTAQKMLISAMGALKLVDERLKALTLEMADLLAQAQAKLIEHDDRAATDILKEKQELEEHIAGLNQEKTLHQQSIDTIKRGLAALENHIGRLRTKAHQSPNHLKDTSAFDTFARMEDKIEASEAETQALAELLKLSDKEEAGVEPAQNPHAPGPGPALSLEQELEALKKKLKAEK